jgi:phosphoglucomutase
MRFDGMSAVSGPYAKAIIEGMLGAPAGTVINAEPLEDFGGHHPDPNPVNAAELIALMNGPDAPDFGAASDGDGDRNMIVGRKLAVAPSDSLAIIAANATLAPGYRAGIKGIARSMPTSTAADRVAAALGISCFETPTGWKYFGNLLDAGMATLCGEESYGTGSEPHPRKGWPVGRAVLAEPDRRQRQVGQPARAGTLGPLRPQLLFAPRLRSRRRRRRRQMMQTLRASLPGLAGQTLRRIPRGAGRRFRLHRSGRPVGRDRQGIRIIMTDGSRIVLRLSGTGTEGATVRLYLERYEADPSRHNLDTQEALAPLIAIAEQVSELKQRTGRSNSRASSPDPSPNPLRRNDGFLIQRQDPE